MKNNKEIVAKLNQSIQSMKNFDSRKSLISWMSIFLFASFICLIVFFGLIFIAIYIDQIFDFNWIRGTNTTQEINNYNLARILVPFLIIFLDIMILGYLLLFFLFRFILIYYQFSTKSKNLFSISRHTTIYNISVAYFFLKNDYTYWPQKVFNVKKADLSDVFESTIKNKNLKK